MKDRDLRVSWIGGEGIPYRYLRQRERKNNCTTGGSSTMNSTCVLEQVTQIAWVSALQSHRSCISREYICKSHMVFVHDHTIGSVPDQQVRFVFNCITLSGPLSLLRET